MENKSSRANIGGIVPLNLARISGILLGLYRDNGKENGNYYSIVGYILGL